jgi:hypothetical protein
MILSILKFYTGWRLVISFMLRPLCPFNIWADKLQKLRRTTIFLVFLWIHPRFISFHSATWTELLQLGWGYSVTWCLIFYTYKNGCLCICVCVYVCMCVCVCVCVCLYVYVCLCVCVCVSPGITLERLERFRPNLVHTFLYVCVRILCIFYIYIPQGGWCGRQGIWMIHIVEKSNYCCC